MSLQIDLVQVGDGQHDRGGLPSVPGQRKTPASERLELSAPPARARPEAPAAHPQRCWMHA